MHEDTDLNEQSRFFSQKESTFGVARPYQSQGAPEEFDTSIKLDWQGVIRAEIASPIPLNLEIAPKSQRQFVEIPVLKLGETADPKGTQIFRRSDEAAKVYEASKDAIVRIAVQQESGKVVGSGFFVEKDGTIATDYHVIDGAKSIEVKTSDGKIYTASLDKHRSTADLAILKLNAPDYQRDFPALPLAKTSESMNKGERIYAMGHPHGWQKLYLSPGTFDTLRSGGSLGFNPQRLSIDAFVHVEPGNSGGPILNSKGEVVGLTRAAVADATQKTGVLHDMLDSEALKAQFTTVDDLRKLMGREQTSTSSSYLMPSQLRFNSEHLSSATNTAFAGLALRQDIKGHGSLLGNAVVPLVAGSQLYFQDFPFLKNAMSDGSRAELINAGINVGSDLMMMSGPLLRMNAQTRVLAGSLQIAGAGVRLANDLLSGRRFD